MWSSAARANSDGSRVLVAVAPAAEQHVDARLTRRLIALEVSELMLALRPMDVEEANAALFYEVRLLDDGMLGVELWEAGRLVGVRRVSVAGAPQLLARRIALVAAELVRHRNRLYQSERKRQINELVERRHAERRQRLELRRRDWALSSALSAAWLSEEAWLFGPELGALLHQGMRWRLRLGASALVGVQESGAEQAPLQWWEVNLAPSYRLGLGGGIDLDLRLEAAAAVVTLLDKASVDGVRGQMQGWSARGGLGVFVQPRLARDLRLDMGLRGGAVLRPVPFEQTLGSPAELGGFWGGLALGVLIGP